MSLDVVIARVNQIVAAQQQLSLPPQAAATASAGTAATTSAGVTQSVAPQNASTFAQALASAQSTPTQQAGATTAGGTVVPQTSWNPEHKPIASWIVPVLQWASEHGWTGTVTSGYRSYEQQAAINASGAYSAPAGKSNHETTTYPGGAVDVTDPSQLLSVLQGYTGPQKLVGGVLGPVDPEHFSATGH